VDDEYNGCGAADKNFGKTGFTGLDLTPLPG
jgi:hypothetical protein